MFLSDIHLLFLIVLSLCQYYWKRDVTNIRYSEKWVHFLVRLIQIAKPSSLLRKSTFVLEATNKFSFFIDRWSFWFFVTGIVTTAEFLKGCHKMIEVSRLSTFSTLPATHRPLCLLLASPPFSLVTTWEWTYLWLKSNIRFKDLLSEVASTFPGGWMLRLLWLVFVCGTCAATGTLFAGRFDLLAGRPWDKCYNRESWQAWAGAGSKWWPAHEVKDQLPEKQSRGAEKLIDKSFVILLLNQL